MKRPTLEIRPDAELRDAHPLVMSMSLALVEELAWFALVGKVASIERAEAAAFLPD